MALEDFAAVVAAFRVPGPLTDVEPVGGGHIHGSWRIVAAGRTWFLQRLNPRVFPEPRRVARLGADVARHLADRLREPPLDLREELAQVVAPRPVPTRAGDLVHTAADGGAWRLSTWVDGATSRAVARDADDCHVAGRAFGALHRLLEDLDPAAITPVWAQFHATEVRLGALAAAAARDTAGRRSSCLPELAVIASHAPAAPAFASLRLPLRVVHNDAKLANLLLAESGPGWRAVVDWDTAGPGSRLHDFGDLVRSLVSGAAEDEPDPAAVVVEPQRWQALRDGYLATAGGLLTPGERAHLRLAGQVITLEQAARFLTDHLEGDVYYRVEDPGHNLRRARAQLALLAQL